MGNTVKLSYELGKIGKGMKLTFHLLLSNSDTGFSSSQIYRYHNEFTIGDSEYYRLSLHPFITIDIGALFKDDPKNPIHTLSLTNINRFKFCRALHEILKGFKEEDLFRYNVNKRLYVTKEIAEKYNQRNLVLSNRTCELIYVIDTEDQNEIVQDSEAVAFLIDRVDNYCILSEEETFELYSILDKIDYHELGLLLYTYYITKKNEPGFKLNKIDIVPRFQVEEPIKELETDVIPRISNKNTFPKFSKFN